MSRFPELPSPPRNSGPATPGAAWSAQGAAFLDSYLVQEVENPCFNPQSVLIRAFLADFLAPGQFYELIEQELYYSAAAAYAMLGWREGWYPDLGRSLWSSGEKTTLPGFMQNHEERARGTFCLRDLFNDLSRSLLIGFEAFRSPFEALWKTALAPPAAVRPAVLELGCGSANDYRCWHSYGFAGRVNYTGIDLCPENIANAAARFPGVEFAAGDICALPFGNECFDITCAFDLLEHLSPEGLRLALAEMVRVTRDEIWLSFFNLSEAAEHEFRTEDGCYYCNLLSAEEMCAALEELGCTAELISVSGEFASRFPGYRHYNPEAHIVVARR